MLENKEPLTAKKSFVSLFVQLLNSSILISSTFIFITWLAVWQFGRLVEYTDHASVWFPAAGFTFSCLLVLGRKAVLPIMFGAILITIWQIQHYQISLTLKQQIWAGFLFGLAHILPYWLGASILAKMTNKAGIGIPKLIVTFLLIAGLCTLIVAVLVLFSLVVTNQLEFTKITKTILPFWIGDMAGVVVLGPVFTAWLVFLFPHSKVNIKGFIYSDLSSLRQIYFKIGLNIFLIFVSMMLAYLSKSEESAFAIFFLTVTHMWIACTESPVVNVISLAISSCCIVLLVHFFNLMDYVLIYQFALNVIGANALFGIAIPQLKAVNQELTAQVNTDVLTKVATRQYLMQRVELEINYCHKNKLALSLAIFDLDDFKEINDSYGHSTGDLALQNVCLAVNKMINKEDLIARFGGDEFVLLLPNQDINSALQLVDEIKNTINKIKIENTLLSLSFGIAELQDGEDFTQLFNRTDKALYRSKQSGGNQINLAT
jgi:diguanylate cyclase (GGDEF)-like protein